MAIKELESRFGSVCPLLKLSEHYKIDYGVVLMAADYVVHKRFPIGLSDEEVERRNASVLNHPQYEEIEIETRVITNWMREQHREAEQLEAQGRLFFDRSTGKWSVSEVANANH